MELSPEAVLDDPPAMVVVHEVAALVAPPPMVARSPLVALLLPPAIVAASDVFVLPTFREGLSRAVIEAMAYSVPSIVTRVGGNTELIEDGVSGLVVPVGDVQALATAMERFYDDPDLRRRFGEAARHRIAKHFRNEDTVIKTLEIYKEILSE